MIRIAFVLGLSSPSAVPVDIVAQFIDDKIVPSDISQLFQGHINPGPTVSLRGLIPNRT